jgi:hypothetical protein
LVVNVPLAASMRFTCTLGSIENCFSTVTREGNNPPVV